MTHTPSPDSSELPAEISFSEGRTRVTVQVESPQNNPIHFHNPQSASASTDNNPIPFAPLTKQLAPRLGEQKRRLRAIDLESWLFILSILIYLFIRLYRLPDFPIYFFTDEAVQTVLAQDFVHGGLRGSDQVLFPTYFLNTYQYNLGVSVYLQVLPYLLFGKSILVTRGVSVLVGLLAALSVGFITRHFINKTAAWGAVLFLSMTPAWFLHSRTAFETAIAVSFYAGFLYFYFSYRNQKPQHLYTAVILAALAFYSYSPAQMVIVLTAFLFFVFDWQYHRAHKKTVLRAVGLIILCAVPYIRFQFNHPEETVQHLRLLNSYWLKDQPFSQKLLHYLGEYAQGLNPFYWYLPGTGDLSRHVMKGYGNLLRTTLPFGIAGVFLACKNLRNPVYRALLIVLLAAPSGAALVEVGITRLLFLVIPAAILTAIAFQACLEWLNHHLQVSKIWLSVSAFVLLSVMNMWILHDALVNGPLWFNDYGMNGMQFGAQQVFGDIDQLLKDQPGQRIELTSTWANGADVIARFFFNDPLPFQIGSISGYFDQRRPEINTTLFIMTPEEFGQVALNPKFKNIRIERIQPYPNGQSGFYFVRLQYAPNIDQILEKERAERRILREEVVPINGQQALVKYSYLDIGEIGKLFDGDENTLIRTMEANPFKLEIHFDQPILMHQVMVRVGGVPSRITLHAFNAQADTSYDTMVNLPEDPDPRTVPLELPQETNISDIHIEVFSTNENEPAHVHVWEVKID